MSNNKYGYQNHVVWFIYCNALHNNEVQWYPSAGTDVMILKFGGKIGVLFKIPTASFCKI
jgi:hypothetical protein